MKRMMTTTASAIGGTAWADPLATVVTTVSVLMVVLFGMAIWAWCLGPNDRDIDDLVKLRRVLFGRGRDPDPDHPPDRRRDPV